jgi:hypothetical protein
MHKTNKQTNKKTLPKPGISKERKGRKKKEMFLYNG